MLFKTTLQILAVFLTALFILPTQGLAQNKRANKNQRIINETVRYIYPNDSSPQIRIFGIIIDKNGYGIPFVNLQVDTFHLGTTADFDGYYDFVIHTSQIPEWSCSIPLPITISCLSYEKQCIAIMIPSLNSDILDIELNATLQIEKFTPLPDINLSYPISK